ncbi:unnamed protein product [Closterium sp. NIES-54]
MNHIIQPLLDECIVVYLDDILIYSKNMKQHVEHLQKVFKILRENKFYVKLSKSDFALKKVQFLGHMGSAKGVHVDPRKTEAVKKRKVLEKVKELQQLLGFANYYNRFLPQYAKIATPQTNLLKKDTPYKWDTPQQQAMEQLQTPLTRAPVLILPDPNKDYVVEADASDQAVGAVLMQDHRRMQPQGNLLSSCTTDGNHLHHSSQPHRHTSKPPRTVQDRLESPRTTQNRPEPPRTVPHRQIQQQLRLPPAPTVA